MNHALICPRDNSEIKSESDLRKHMLCFYCREKMLKLDWLIENIPAIETNWPGYMDKLIKEMNGYAMQEQTEKIARVKRNIDLYMRLGSTGDQKKDSTIKEIIRRAKNETMQVSRTHGDAE